jgi:protein-S-isoprenylcysteine O-methyltransferase Ste14
MSHTTRPVRHNVKEPFMPSLDTVLTDAWLPLLAVWILASLKVKRKAYTERPDSRIGHLLTIAAAAALLFSARARVGILGIRVVPASAAAAAIALALTVAGVLFAIWARLYLGGNWSAVVAIKHGHKLVRTGPYKIVRHPIYAGIVTAMLGNAIGFGEFGCLLAVAIAFAAFLAKARMEDAFLDARFGPAHQHYREQVKTLIPLVL